MTPVSAGQYCPIELSATIGRWQTCTAPAVATSHVWLLNAYNVASAMEEWGFTIGSVLAN